jgi:DNA-binding NarL/FixJ family response regulator
MVPGIFEDKTELAIGLALGISEGTVHMHMDELRRKLDVLSRAAVVACVMRGYIRMQREDGGAGM